MMLLHAKNLALPPRLLPMSFSIKGGEIVHLIGPNGSGKSTVMSLLSGLEIGQGDVFLDECSVAQLDLTSLAHIRSYLTQQDKPAFAMRVYQYMSLTIAMFADLADKQVNVAVDEIANRLNISDKLTRNIQSLSGGEWQRVRIATALLQVDSRINPDAKLLLLDEPAAALDVGQEAALYRILRQVADQGIAVVVANHDLNRTLREADTVLVLKNGSCVAKGAPKQVMTESLLHRVFQTPIKRIVHQGQDCLLFME